MALLSSLASRSTTPLTGSPRSSARIFAAICATESSTQRRPPTRAASRVIADDARTGAPAAAAPRGTRRAWPRARWPRRAARSGRGRRRASPRPRLTRCAPDGRRDSVGRSRRSARFRRRRQQRDEHARAREERRAGRSRPANDSTPASESRRAAPAASGKPNGASAWRPPAPSTPTPRTPMPNVPRGRGRCGGQRSCALLRARRRRRRGTRAARRASRTRPSAPPCRRPRGA